MQMPTESKGPPLLSQFSIYMIGEIHPFIYEKGFFYAKWAYTIYMFI